jgi:hypothetical protein
MSEAPGSQHAERPDRGSSSCCGSFSNSSPPLGVAQPAQKTLRILAFGDSLTHGMTSGRPFTKHPYSGRLLAELRAQLPSCKARTAAAAAGPPAAPGLSGSA